MSTKAFLAATAALLVLGAGGCRYTSDPGAYGALVPVQGVKVTLQVLQLLAVGDTARLLATVAPANATDPAIAWESTDSTVASVSATGLVTARAVGSGVFITVITHDGSHQASVNVSVGP